MISLSSRNRELLTVLKRNAAVLIAYLAFSALTDPASAVANGSEALFSAAGVALGALLLFGFTVLPAVAIGAFVAALWSADPTTALVASSAAVLGSSCGYILIGKFGNSRNRLRTLPQLGVFLAAGALIMPLVSATIGCVGLKFTGMLPDVDLVGASVNWWLSDSLSVVLLVPALFAGRGLVNLGRSNIIDAEAALLTTVQCAITAALFLGPWFEPVALTYLLLPVATIIALRYRLPSTAFTNLFTYAIVVAGTAAQGDVLSAGALLLQFQFVILVCTTLLISVSARQRTATLAGVKESESRYRSITELSTDWYWEQDEDFLFTLVSSGADTGAGIPARDHIGKTLWEVYPSESNSSGWQKHQRELQAHLPFEFTFHKPANDGSAQTLSIVGQPLTDNDDAFRGYRGIVRDITPQLQQKSALEDEKRFLDDILNAISSPVIVKDDAHRLIMLNDAAVHYLARPREKLIGSTDFDLFPPDQASRFHDIDESVLVSNKPVEYEHDYSRNGVTRRMYVRTSAPDNGDDNRVLVSLLTDVTDRQTAETALRQSEDHFRSLTALSADWYWQQDENLRFTDMSEQTPGAAGFDEKTLIGKTRFELPVAWSSERDKNEHLQTLLAREPFRDVVMRNPGNRYTLVSGEPIFDDDGRFRGYRGVGRDVTDIKRAQEAAEKSRQFFADLINSVPSAISVKDKNHHYLEVNEAFCQMVGASREQIIGNTDDAFIEGEVLATLQEMDQAALESDEPVSYESGFGRGDTQAWFLARKNAMSSSAGERILVSAFTNLTDRKRVEEALQSSELRFRDFAEAAGEFLWETDQDQRFTFVSPRVLFTLGYTPEEFTEQLTSEFMPDKEAARIDEWKTQNARTDKSFHGLEHMVVHKGGEIVWLLTNGLAIHDEHGEFVGHRGTSADITSRKSDEARIHQLATRDALTELPNRVLLKDRVGHAVQACRRDNMMAALLFVDLDHFKTINDSLGHPIGDALLKEVAIRLKHCVRGGDTVSRFGGDEFVVLIEHLDDAQNAAQVAQKILDALAQPFEIAGQMLASGCSIGIAIIPTDGEVLETLLKNADTAMYSAKEGGRNNYQFFALQMTQHAVRRHKIEMELRDAVANKQLLMHYQPQVEVASGKIVAVEALMRWQHPERGLIESASFIPVAEESGLIASIGTWALETVCAQAKQWQIAGIPLLRVAVNISPRQTLNPDAFAQLVADQLKVNELDGNILELEMTESPLLKHADTNAVLLRRLGQIGVKVAVDGFGKGSSSLAYLKQSAINSLKIDRSFIRNIESDPEDLAIVKAIIAMARNLKLRVIAEGVETKQQLNLLKKLGCQVYQGFYFARPMSAQELFERYFANSPLPKSDGSKRRSTSQASASRPRARTG
jgi:diguanylate cyclase (GGDEF)-like protein/PAS domain S-box-containing protein